MASLQSAPSRILVPITPDSIQPGGFGFCTRLELAWGRLRRSYLRRLRPTYVRRMLQLRQGNCSGCTHDIIDSRDLKYFENVCGYSFRPEEDAFSGRNGIGLARAGLAEVLFFSVAFALGIALSVTAAVWVTPVFWVAVAALAVLWFFVVFFFRDPHRVVSSDPAALISPADGTVTDIGEVDDPDFPGGRALRISIFLSVFNVHVNRAPRTGKVTAVRYFRGEFLDARHAECARRNEQLWLDLEEDGRSSRLVRVKQISGAIARRIVCRLRIGDTIQAGERFGMIKFGSRTEVLLPVDGLLEVQVKVGDQVHGGSTTLGRFKS